ncbi:hypothetical protein O3S80_50490 [Streptomyces sp. Lzd4kr]|nr:hypothetical protein [Streptomyces sp. Lzd4kr]
MRPRKRMRRSEQTVEVPERVYRGPHYSDAFKKAWCKMAALDTDGNIEHCNASVANMAAYTGLSKSSFERALTEGRRPGPDGGAPEFTTRRMTHRGGLGRTAIREVRGVAYGERFVTVPVWIVDAAEPRELAAVLLVAHAEKDGHPLTAEELAGELFHHHGKSKGEPVSERTARRVIDACEAGGFLNVDRRGGYRGRHVLTVRDIPLEAVPDAPAPPPASEPVPTGSAPCPDNHDGSGPDNGDGSLAIKEDSEVCTDGSTHRRGSFRRRRDDRKWVGPPVDNSRPGSVASVAPATFRPAVRPPERPAYAGPPLTLHPRVWAVLDPVADLLPAVSDFTVRRIAREIGRQLDTGVLAEDIRDQLSMLRRWTMREDIRDPAAWILGAGLRIRPSWCGTADCVRGYQRYTGTPCKACAELAADRARTAHPPHTNAWHECAHCHAPSRIPLPSGPCLSCQPAQPTGT